uniref:Uncharacterized protein n=1 Tax=Strigamia maritima TaxID=126957 RepID=T1J813_STRMM
MWHVQTFLLKYTLRTGAIVTSCFTLINSILLVASIFIFPVARVAKMGGSAGETALICGGVLILDAILGIVVCVFLLLPVTDKKKFSFAFYWLIWQVMTMIIWAILVITDILTKVYTTIPILLYLIFMGYLWFVIYSFYWRLRDDNMHPESRSLKLSKTASFRRGN